MQYGFGEWPPSVAFRHPSFTITEIYYSDLHTDSDGTDHAESDRTTERLRAFDIPALQHHPAAAGTRAGVARILRGARPRKLTLGRLTRAPLHTLLCVHLHPYTHLHAIFIITVPASR